MALDVDRALAPAGSKATIGLLAGVLFLHVPMPPKQALPKWVERLQRFPADTLARAVDEIIDTHMWGRPPRIAELVQACRRDPEYQRRRAAELNLQLLRLKPPASEPVKLTAEEKALELARRQAQQQASDAHRDAPWPVRQQALIDAFETAKADPAMVEALRPMADVPMRDFQKAVAALIAGVYPSRRSRGTGDDGMAAAAE